MAVSSIFRYFMTIPFLIFVVFFGALSVVVPVSPFAFRNFGNDSGFESEISLFGDAKIVDGGSAVQLTRSAAWSAGRVVCGKPIKLVEGNPRRKVSFSTYFSFSISPDNGDGLALAILPIGFPVDVFNGSSFGLSPGLWEDKFKVLAVEFDTFRDANYSDLNDNHVGIDIGNSLVSVAVRNASSLNLVLTSGERMHSWIDYEAGSNRLEVRLSKFGSMRPVDPLLSYPIDLAEVWMEEEVIVGLTSSSRNSSQTCSVYSWSFKLRHAPHWLHSLPLDPGAVHDKSKPPMDKKRSTCLLRFLAALIFGTGCGALGSFIVLFVWTICGNRRPVVPEEFAVCPVEFEYKKIKVVVDKAIKDGEK
ncbi:L-type lectin-domain containing receptor kinase VIII.2-like [Malania oleifera]|uniref:L-type lectin-domain containing receptor kinase VIII.2-like n=1 Tax=Malania oleifera TaxID=397392 RepID=UPI0025AE8719|nr:L-type lectin-domain containing receptor kinase VIII.2-like [Malania oleifera]